MKKSVPIPKRTATAVKERTVSNVYDGNDGLDAVLKGFTRQCIVDETVNKSGRCGMQCEASARFRVG